MRALLVSALLFGHAISANAAITPEELRTMAYAGDVHGSEAAFAQAHRETLDGTLTYGELRALVSILIVTHPDVLEFTEDWREAYPDSPYAKSLWAFQHLDISWTLRGNAVARRVSREAMQTFNMMQREGMAIAIEAYEIAPDYVPASDAVLMLNMTTDRFGPSEHYDILTDVMDVTPNRGSLARASLSSSRHWGGRGYETLIGLCDQFAAKVSDVENYTSDVCTIDLIHYYSSTSAERAYSYELMEDHDHPTLALARAVRGLDRASPEDRAHVIAYLSQPYTLDDRMIREFQRNFRLDDEANQFLALYDQKKRDFVEEGLLHDPYSADVLFRAFDFYTGYAPLPGTTVPVYDADMAKITNRLARRYVAASPYTGHAWTRLANSIDLDNFINVNLRDEAIANDPIRTNAVYYSNHSNGALVAYLQSKVVLYARLRDLNDNDRRDVLSEAEELTHVVCPIIRLNRLNTAVCEAGEIDDQRCYMWSSTLKDRIMETVSDIERRGLCHSERNATLTDLLYTEPVAFDLGEMNEGIANR